MSERKVLNKYIPPNFDPELVKRIRLPREKQYVVRLMAPFSMRCNTCGEYIYKGRKFNARKEDAEGEEYLGIQIYRFYVRCPMCAAEITFKTDPQNSDYTCEHGARRNFEPWREEEQGRTLRDKMRQEEEERNPMKALENKSMDSKKEMELMSALDDIRSMNARAQRVDTDELLKNLPASKTFIEAQEKRKIEDQEDDAIIREVFSKKKKEAVDGMGSLSKISASKNRIAKPVDAATGPARPIGSLPTYLSALRSVSKGEK